MRFKSSFAGGLGWALLAALPVWPQGLPTGALAGHVAGANQQPLPGVTVSISSPSLQGSRAVTTNSNGDYLVALLPPGSYQVSFELDGFQKAERKVVVAAGQTAQAVIELDVTGVAEVVTVTAQAERVEISKDSQASTTYDFGTTEKLPLRRDPFVTALMSPGINDNGPNQAITISGSQSYENLFLINGVVVNENLRGQPLDLFIEDAVEETTTTTSGASAEYGRFGGGVVSVITKSGGNAVHGSFRDSLDNESWKSRTPLSNAQLDKTNDRYEATLGGFLWKDRLWFFGAGRDADRSTSNQTVLTNITFPVIDKEARAEGKFTLSPSDGQRLVASYSKINREIVGDFQALFNANQPPLDLATLNNPLEPQELLSFNYNGVFSSNFYAEAQYSRRKFAFQKAGATSQDLIKGTYIVDDTNGYIGNSPPFCGVCGAEDRNNENILAKGSWFLSTPSLGSHDVVFGYDTFNDIRKANNFQSGSNFRVFYNNTIPLGQSYTTNYVSQGNEFIQWFPISVLSKGTNFRTNSFYANDRWRLNDHLSFNAGVRFDKNDGSNADGAKVAKDSKVSPRLGLIYDLLKDGNWIFNANYGRYVTAIANSQADSTSRGGTPSNFLWQYTGPVINGDANGPFVTPQQALQQVFDWFNSIGGVNNVSNLVFAILPGGNEIIRGSLKSPSTDEWSAGVSKRLGNRGFFRTDYVHRKSADFYAQVTTTATGHVNTANGPTDLTVLTNTSTGTARSYNGLHTQLQYRVLDRLSLGASWALTETRGNFDGELPGTGPVATGALQYPEYKDPRWNNPTGDLASDQRHRVRLYGIFNILHGTNTLDLGFIGSHFSGTPYGAVGPIDDRPFVHNPGYLNPPSQVNYYFTARDAFHTPSVNALDLNLNYGFHWGVLGKDIEVFMQPLVQNVLNAHHPFQVSSATFTDQSDPNLRPFNPFTATPVEGVNWRKDPKFGQPLGPADFQTPRTFRFSVGFRF
ncbi:MAG TPA: TonB-dependent receptor [Thermoanaerobaculia bacterium]|nr:TonB-dependent receptor [Thermoanaerobaculia bacterium]